MADTVATIKRVMAAAGAPADMIERAIEVLNEDRKALQRARKARWNEKNVPRNAKNVPNVRSLKVNGNGNAENVPSVTTSPITIIPSLTTLKSKGGIGSREGKGGGKRPIDPNFRPSDQDWAKWQAKTGFDDERMRLETSNYRNYWMAKGEHRADWDAGWRTWMGKAMLYKPVTTNGARPMSAKQAAKQEIYKRLEERAERIENGQFSGVEGMGEAQGGTAGAGSRPHSEPITRFGFRCRSDSEDAE